MEINENTKKRRSISGKLRKIFAGIPEDKKKIADKLIDMAAFSAVAVEELQHIILTEGYIVEYQNGENQKGTKDNPAVKMRVTEISNLLKIIEALTEMCIGESVSDELDSFLSTVRQTKQRTKPPPKPPEKPPAKRGKK